MIYHRVMQSTVDGDTGDGPPDLRARRRAQTQAEIHSAILELAIEHGYDRVTVDDIAARAGVSPRTFFRYFPTKDSAIAHDRWGFGRAIRRMATTVSGRTLRLADIDGVYLGLIRDLVDDQQATDALARTHRVTAESAQLAAATFAAFDTENKAALELLAGQADFATRSRARLLLLVAQGIMTAALAEWTDRYEADKAAHASATDLLDIYTRLAAELRTPEALS
ncbi:TetR family transcriptional regulator [Nocardia brasiliensis]|uniref:TetR/AcrR family transcriptional regulator n=1 Tax=Nocardia brasiliensis TaxID=37326 RepID=UPI00379805A7